MMKIITTFIFALCSFFLHAQKQLEKLPRSINSDQYDELSPVLSTDNNRLYFTRTGDPSFINVIAGDKKERNPSKLKRILGQIAGKQIENPSTSSYNQDVFYVSISNQQQYGEVIHPDFPLNNAFPNSVLANFPGEKAIVVMNQFDPYGGIKKGFSKVRLIGQNGFGFPEAMAVKDIDNQGNEISMTMSADAELIFIAMRRGDSRGETDIYISYRLNDNIWSVPKPLKSPINTSFKETAPFISKNKKHLYFASNRLGSSGGLDIYVSDRLDYTYLNWSKPRLLPFPINTEHNESQPYLDDAGDYIYFTSKRDGTSDIFRYHLTAKKMLDKPLNLTVRILDEETKQPVRGEIHWGIAHEEGYEGFFRAYGGVHEVELKKNEMIKFKAIKRGYIGDEAIIDPEIIVNDNVTKHILDLFVRKEGRPPKVIKELPEPFGKKRTITLKNLNFERSESVVLPKSFVELDKLVDVLKDFPNIHIRIEGHSDNVGDKALLLQLSEKRAQAIKAHLVARGVNAIRIETAGYGDRFPLNDNATENERRRNRRVEIRIISE